MTRARLSKRPAGALGRDYCDARCGVPILSNACVLKHEYPDNIILGSDCSGLGTDAIVLKAMCKALPGKVDMTLGFASESDPAVRVLHKTLTKHYKVKVCNTFRDITLRCHHGVVDLYIAGAPCQPWSSLADGKGVEDKSGRGSLMYYVVHYITTGTPKAFILENVVGMLNRHIEDFATILLTLEVQRIISNGGIIIKFPNTRQEET